MTEPEAAKALCRADTLLNMKHGLVRLDNVWGVGGGIRPVKYLVKQIMLLLKVTFSNFEVFSKSSLLSIFYLSFSILLVFPAFLSFLSCFFLFSFFFLSLLLELKLTSDNKWWWCCVQEYLCSCDVAEATRCLADLEVPHFHHELVYEVVLKSKKIISLQKQGRSSSIGAKM